MKNDIEKIATIDFTVSFTFKKNSENFTIKNMDKIEKQLKQHLKNHTFLNSPTVEVDFLEAEARYE